MTLNLYRRGHFPRETLATLWGYIERDGAWAKLFYAQPVDETPFPTRGDLPAFVGYFEDPKRILLIVEDEGQPMGMVWFDDIYVGHRAAINAYYRRRYWGHRTRVATKEAAKVAFQTMAIKTLWAYTPWREAFRHAQAIGMQHHATLEDFALVDGSPRDVLILRMRKEDLDG